jgi:outer membrane protein TolC
MVYSPILWLAARPVLAVVLRYGVAVASVAATLGTSLILRPPGWDPACFFWSVGAAALQTLFDGGRRHAVSAEAQAGYDAAVASYRQIVLNAFQEVEDNLAVLRVQESEASTQAEAVEAAQQSLELSETRYTGGATSYLEVITAQSTALADERTAVQIRGSRMAATVRLIEALGGGWDTSQLPSPHDLVAQRVGPNSVSNVRGSSVAITGNTASR